MKRNLVIPYGHFLGFFLFITPILINGQNKWSQVYKSDESNYSAIRIIESGNSEFYICGQKDGSGLILKISSEGYIISEKLLDSSSIVTIVELEDKSLIAFGFTWPRELFGRITKLDSSLNIVWDYTYQIGYACSIRDGKVLDNGNLIAVGSTTQGDNYDFWMLITDQNGKTISSNTYGDKRTEQCYSFVSTIDGGFVLVGKSKNEEYNFHVITAVKTNEQGVFEWIRRYNFDGVGYGITNSNNGGYLIAGVKTRNVYFLEINSKGDSISSSVLMRGYGKSIRKISDSGYVVSAYGSVWGSGTYSDAIEIKLDKFGNLVWQNTIGWEGDDFGSDATQLMDGSILFLGTTRSFWPYSNCIFLIKSDSLGNYERITDVKLNDNFHIDFKLSQNYPNPFNPTTVINYQIPNSHPGGAEGAFVQLKVYDILGKEVETLLNQKQNPGYYQVEFDGSNLSSGVYFYKLSSNNYTETKKMVLLR
jgi:flagellar hook assembly protein FlgD